MQPTLSTVAGYHVLHTPTGQTWPIKATADLDGAIRVGGTKRVVVRLVPAERTPPVLRPEVEQPRIVALLDALGGTEHVTLTLAEDTTLDALGDAMRQAIEEVAGAQ